MNKEDVFELIKANISLKSVWMKTNLKKAHIAVLMKRGKILEIASNFVGSRQGGCGYDDRSIHAERAVIKKMGDNTKLSGAIMIVIRVSRGTNQIANSKPCDVCQCHLDKCIKKYGLKCIYYSQ
jgi:hypothetical protein